MTTYERSSRSTKNVFVPYNAKIADITHADTNKHTLALDTALSETRTIIAILVSHVRQGGTGDFYIYPNEGTDFTYSSNLYKGDSQLIIIAAGTQRLQYGLSVANDDWDLYCWGYIVEED